MRRPAAGCALLTLLFGGVVLLAYSGWLDVSSSARHLAPVEWWLTTTRDRGIERASAAVEVPDLSGPERAERGRRLYTELCEACHGGPGVPPSATGRGLHPSPPDLATSRLSKQEARRVFWVTRHGLRMTGMPAYGESLTDEQIWDLVAFLGRMGEMAPHEYRP